MAQQINLNVSPYFDDFDSSNDYYKVLFKPGYPVQARELTGLQSILQNQIEKFGTHMFKDGAKVIPGNTTFDTGYYALELNDTHLGVPIEAYLSQLVGKKIIGLSSGVTAEVVNFITADESERGNPTVYVSYLSTGVDNVQSVFSDGELLTSDSDIVSGPENNIFIPAGESIASAISEIATSVGCAFSIDNGVYFVRGTFANVSAQTLILSQYSNTPSLRIGFRVLEETVNSDEDESLTDNSKGFNNYAAPGADRLKITCSLFAKDLDDLNDANFIELVKVQDGIIKTDSNRNTSQYNLIGDELAKRTFAESGDYTVVPFDVNTVEALNNGIGNNGIYQEGQRTPDGSVVSDDIGLYSISPGRAFVKGYDVETISDSLVEFPKPRSTAKLTNQAVIYNTGVTIRVNGVSGSPQIGVGNTYIVSLRDRRVGSTRSSSAGSEIGLARIYDFALESGSYDAQNGNVNQWDLSLFDVQFQTNITLNESTTLSVPTFVKGKYSGATAFLRSDVSNSTSISVYEKNGDFLVNEPFIFNGIEDSRVAIAVTSFGMSDVKSVYGGPDISVGPGATGVGQTFNADPIQKVVVEIGPAKIAGRDRTTGLSSVTSTNPNFPGILKINSLVKFTNTAGAASTTTTARVVSVGSSSINIIGVTTLPGTADGTIPAVGAGNLQNVNDFKIVATPLADAKNNRLYTEMPKRNISDVDLSDAQLIIRKSFDVIITTDDQLNSAVTTGDNETFLAFDEERYSLVRNDGTIEVLTSDKMAFTSGNTILQINNIGTDLSANMEAKLITTIKKLKPKAKIKRKNRVNNVVITASKLNGSGIGATTLNDGLSFGTFPFGTRVQDEKISINSGDVLDVLGIFESFDTADPTATRMTLTSISSVAGKTSDLIIGERITGTDSGAVAIVAERETDSRITILYQTDDVFREGESVRFAESNLQAIITTLDDPSKDVSANYTFNTGQKATFYGHGFLTRKPNVKEPSKRLKIYFESGYYESSDDGDITTKNSYDTFDYGRDIQTINGNRNTDIIDIRPKVSNYTIAESTRSPLEFLGRSFTTSGNSATNILASDESIVTNYSFYGGRIDRLYVDQGGGFRLVTGLPAEDPEKPDPINNVLEIATIELPPYLYRIEDASISFLDHKRFTMRDIGKLEDRIRNLEYYTSLTMLETETANLFIPDNAGLNRFKSGFFVDNFTSFQTQEDEIRIKNSIDQTNKECRPTHYTNAVDLVLGPVEGVDLTQDSRSRAPEGNNIRKTGDIITLNYEEIEYEKQPFATRTEFVTPFLLSFWRANIKLTPASDTWTDTARLKAKVIDVEGNYSDAVVTATREFGGFDPQTGLTPILWNSWQTRWTGTDSVTRRRNRTEITGRTNFQTRTGEDCGGTTIRDFERTTRTTFQDTFVDNFRSGFDSRNGRRQLITPQIETSSLGDRTVSRDVISFMRSRNIEFVGRGFKPLTQVYPFFDNRSVAKFVVPKLLEIEMVSGTFQVGETVEGTVGNSRLITFRTTQANHKEGPYNAPTRTYASNPYTSTIGAASGESESGEFELFDGGNAVKLPANYSSTSSIINVDTFSLAEQPSGDFFGYVETGMVLRGRTSGAQAKIVNKRLISDLSSDVIGSFFIPNANRNTNPKFATGTKTFTLTDSSTNNTDVAQTLASENYVASGTLETVQETIVSVRNAKVEVVAEREQVNRREFTGTDETTVVTDVATSTTQTGSRFTPAPPPPRRRRRRRRRRRGWDPIAQSFLVFGDTGVFLTSVDIYFSDKDPNDIPVIFQLRTMENGIPTQKILPFSEITVTPAQITTSTDGSVATKITFDAPVYVEEQTEYAMCLVSASTKYKVFISRVGENDLLSDEFVSTQPFLGSFFKSQNASTWEPSQWEDLKFVLNRAKFDSSGTMELYSPVLAEGNGQVPTLMPDPINISSKRIRVGLNTGLLFTGNQLELGNTVYQDGSSNATGNYVGSAGSATGTMSVVNQGIGLTPSSGSLGYIGVALSSITGAGADLTANIHVANGVAVAATVNAGGSGYTVGDVLTLPNGIGNLNAGLNAQFSVVSLGSTNRLILDNVQGDFVTGAGNTVMFTNSVGVGTTLNGNGANVLISSINTVTDGLHVVVDHKNHGMHHEQNRVIISDVLSDIKPTKLSIAYNSSSTTDISVSDESEFGTFENVGVGTTNAGYLLIGDEIISYTETSSNTIGGITRQVDSTLSRNYPAGTLVYKYELGSVSLRRINTTHELDNVTVSNPLILDSYNVKVDMGINGVGRSTGESFPILYFNQTKSTGGSNVKATQNMPFEIITPQIQNLTLPGTSLSAEMTTISGTSINDGSGTGTDLPFVVQEVEGIALNNSNYLNSPRIIASRVNENNNSTVDVLPGNRSLRISLNLSTDDDALSPVIDSQRMSAILTSNRVNAPISNYLTDNRVNSLNDDPTACQYISKENTLENPATSIKVIVDSHINNYADIRVFYAISESSNFEPVFVPFPGYDNLNERGEIIALDKSSGKSDTYNTVSDVSGFESQDLDFREYTFTANDLPSFKSFRVKILLASSNQTYPPRIRDLRVITIT